MSEKGSFMYRKVARKCTSSKSGIKLIKLKWDDMSFCEAADGLESALPATAGATACPPGALCCSVVGNGLGDLPFGVRGILRSSSKSWPAQIPMDFMQVLSSNIYISSANLTSKNVEFNRSVTLYKEKRGSEKNT